MSSAWEHGAFSHRTVVITGASAGIGRATAHRFAMEGTRLGLIARDGAALDEVQREVQALGGEAVCVAADVSDANAVFSAAHRIEREFGPIDVWINDAMVTVFSPVWAMTPDEFRRVTEVTYLGFVHGTMAALQHMRPRNRGTIVQVGSALAYRGIPLQSAYCGAKHAIQGFSESVRTELLHENSRIRITVVNLPAINTPQFDWARTHLPRRPRPAGKIYEPEVAADAIFHAARHPAREYWLGGSTAAAVVGNMVLPELVDRYLASSAVEGQMTKERIEPSRRDNLHEPVHHLHRTRGSFSRKAHSHAVRLRGPSARAGTAAAALALAVGVGLVAGQLAGRSRRSPRGRPDPRPHIPPR